MGHVERVQRVADQVKQTIQLQGDTVIDIRLNGKYIMIKNKQDEQNPVFWIKVAAQLQKALFEAFRLEYKVVHTSTTHASVNCFKKEK
jgi:hypothetical protein